MVEKAGLADKAVPAPRVADQLHEAESGQLEFPGRE
jgi:hypothetical protein